MWKEKKFLFVFVFGFSSYKGDERASVDEFDRLARDL